MIPPNTYLEAIQSWFSTMAEDWNIKIVAGGAMAFLADWFGEDWWMVSMLLTLVFADLLLGLASAIKFNGGLSGRRLHQGIVKFLAYASAIVLVWLVQEISLRSLHVNFPVLALFAAYQALTEISSITRHLERLGIKMPALLHKIAEGGKQKVDEHIDNALGNPEKKEEKDSK